MQNISRYRLIIAAILKKYACPYNRKLLKKKPHTQNKFGLPTQTYSNSNVNNQIFLHSCCKDIGLQMELNMLSTA